MRPELLFVSPRFLFPVDSGGKIRTTQILRGLRGGAFRITLVSPATAAQRREFSGAIDTVCDEFVGWDEPPRSRFFPWLRLRHVFARWPIPVMTDVSAAGARAARALLERLPAVAVFDFPHAALLAPAGIPVPSVMFTHNVEAEIFARHVEVARNPVARWLWSDQHRKMVRFEREALGRFDTVIAVSGRDAEQLRASYGVGNVAVINTGVDLEYFSWSAPAHGEEIIFSGSMDWLANQDGIAFFMDEVWPLIVRARPGARMTVVGRTPPESLIEAVRSRGLNWHFTGYVDDIRPY
ncbi:MAG: glycosyltransferase, partial [Gemmatimonadetes bacterium]|nr:glycosyltransferase [Gemmatimonadota bacterium]